MDAEIYHNIIIERFKNLEKKNIATKIFIPCKDPLCPKYCDKKRCCITYSTLLNSMDCSNKRSQIIATINDADIKIELFGKKEDDKEIEKDIFHELKGINYCIYLSLGHLMMSIGGMSCGSILIFYNKDNLYDFIKKIKKDKTRYQYNYSKKQKVYFIREKVKRGE